MDGKGNKMNQMLLFSFTFSHNHIMVNMLIHVNSKWIFLIVRKKSQEMLISMLNMHEILHIYTVDRMLCYGMVPAEAEII